MDLDFSFALVSSLTPRSQYKKAHPVENNDCVSKLPTTKQKLGYSSREKNSKPIKKTKDLLIQEEKENKPPKDQLMNRNGSCKPRKVLGNNGSQQKLSNDHDSSLQVSIDMANIAIRKNRVKRKNTSPKQLISNALNISNEKIQIERPTRQRNKGLSNGKLTLQEIRLGSSFGSNISGSTSKGCEDCSNQQGKRKSCVLSKISLASLSSTDIVESSVIEEETSGNCNEVVKTSQVNKPITRRCSPRISGLSDTTLSTAYDSDSISKTCRPKNKFKTVLETPETDKSVNASMEEERVAKAVVLETPETDQSLSFSFTEQSKHQHNTSFQKDKDSIPLQNRKCDIEKNNADIDLFQEEIQTSFSNTAQTREWPKKKLRSNGESSLTNMFKLESSIKNQPSQLNQNEVTDPIKKTSCTSKEKRKLSISPILKEINKKDSHCKKIKGCELKGNNFKSTDKKLKNNELEAENTCKDIAPTIDDKKKKVEKRTKKSSSSPLTNVNISNSALVLPTEVIPKSDHVRNWLKSTQEASVISLSSESSFCSPESADIKFVVGKVKKPVSLSPRIKKKMKIAKNTLQEEQQIFEDLYGKEIVERLSGDLNEDEDDSVISFHDSVECSENVLDKLYGTVWQTNHIPQSEPAKGKKKPKATKKTTPQTERKKRRTSIYDVFSSSSSEDRFEEFLESINRGKLKSKRRSNLPSTPDFIKDDTDSNCSLTFYQNIVSSAVKEDINKIRHDNADSVTSSKTSRVRRLSFSSSKDDHCSDKGNSETRTSKKEHKPLPKEKKKRGPKSRSKTKVEEEDSGEVENDVALFTLVTPFKVRDKKSDEKLNPGLSKTKTSVKKPKVPKNVSKSMTPQTSIELDNKTNTEEKLRKKYLGEGDFKVPKCLTSFKTPTKPIKRDIPYSPALSFLSSLSEITGELPCHPDAAVFKKDFKNKREDLARKLFHLFNKEIFENKLPEDMLIEWNARMTSTSGFCYNKRTYTNNHMFRSSRIVLSTKILDRPVRLRDTLIHELCHAATWIVDGLSDGHGHKWKAWAEKSHRRFPELPVIKRCHDYAISTKYTYKCMACGYSIGRHTKSLDVERKRCGYCFGKFQVFVTTKMSNATGTGSDQSSTNTRTPRKPTGFALFVKENYASIKKENNVPHAQVMKLLSQKFAEVKISKLNSDKSGDTQ